MRTKEPLRGGAQCVQEIDSTAAPRYALRDIRNCGTVREKFLEKLPGVIGKTAISGSWGVVQELEDFGIFHGPPNL